MVKQLRPALTLLVVFTIITGVLYPLLITGVAQGFLKERADGSLIYEDGKVVGSSLIGQQFDQPQYFWGRPSGTTGNPYNASGSGGSNYGVLNPALEKEVSSRVEALKAADPENDQPIPVDLVTSSASGLDPEISVAAAEYQAERVARARHLDVNQVEMLIRMYTTGRWLGIFGEPVVNVLQINLALDALQ